MYMMRQTWVAAGYLILIDQFLSNRLNEFRISEVKNYYVFYIIIIILLRIIVLRRRFI